MHINQAIIGQRVVANIAIDIYPLHIWPVGTIGTITEIEQINGQAAVYVKLDEDFPCLDEWANCLIVWEHNDEACNDARLSSFDVVDR